jgi:hypothetical protein
VKSLKCILLLMAIEGLTLSFSGFRACGAADGRKGVEFYLLEDDSMNFEAARKQPLSDLKLKAAPWIASADIERYDWSCHHVYLKKPLALPTVKGAKIDNLAGKPFVVIADGQRCYLGTLWSLLSSSAPTGNTAMIEILGGNLERFELRTYSITTKGESRIDIRDNPAIKESLKRAGQFHAGLECSLDGISAERNESSLTIVYTYTLHNRDEDGLYVLDPKKCPPNDFFTAGNTVVAQNVENDEYIRWTDSIDSASKRTTKKELSWYTLLKKGESMTRLVTMNVTLRVPPEPGKYKFFLNFLGYEPFGNDHLWMYTNDNSLIRLLLNKPDGRIWLGQIGAELTQNIK